MSKANLETWIGAIHNVDCIDGMNQLPAEKVDLVFADPPFNIGYEYDEYDDRLEKEKYLVWSKSWITAVGRILKPTGTFWLAIGDEYAAELKVLSQAVGFHCRSWVIWYYTFGVHCSRKFARSHAHLFHFVKDSANFVFNSESPELRVPSARQLVYRDSRAHSLGRMPDDTWILRPQDLVDGFNPDEDVWYFPRVAGTFKERAGFHGCQMPEQLLGRIVRACSNPGDVVVDPFSGSATTLAVAKKLGRRYFAFELSKDYVRLGSKRLENICVGDRLDGAEEPKVSAPSTAGVKIGRTKKALPGPSPNQIAFGIAPGSDGILENLTQEKQGVLEAFAATNRGYSVDRLVADPILNEDFQLACDKLQISGTHADRNRFLFRLRKAGKIKARGINTTERTNLGWDYVDDFVYASEIAWRQIGNKYCELSLDDIFCDPRVAVQFDEIAAKFAPGYKPLDYRWAALKLRKEGRNMRRHAALRTPRQLGIDNLKKPRLNRIEARPLERLKPSEIPSAPGVYLLRGSPGVCVYAGEADNLRKRIAAQFIDEQTQVQYSRVYPEAGLILLQTESISNLRFARQCHLINWHKPVWNMVERTLCA